MLNLSPADYKLKSLGKGIPLGDMDAIKAFYEAMLGKLGIPTKGVSITPLSANGDAVWQSIGIASVDSYFDIGNLAAGGIPNPAVYPNKSFYHGNLLLTTYVTAIGTTPFYTSWLTTGPNNNLTNWLYKQMNPPIVNNGNINVNGFDKFIDNFDDVIFNFLHTQVGGTITSTNVTTEFLFQGLKIDY